MSLHNSRRKFLQQSSILFILLSITTQLPAQEQQRVEGYDTVVFHYNANKTAPSRDFRGTTRGFMTSGWWAKGQTAKNYLSWQTAVVPAAKATTFSFIAASAVLPSNFTRGPLVKLLVNGQYALSFQIGYNKDFNWKEGDYALKYRSKRVEYPYFGSHRQLELNGNSGIYELTVPASVVKAGERVTLQVELQPFEGWDKGWFMLKDYKDVLQHTIESLQSEIETMRQDLATIIMQTQILASQQYQSILDTTKYEHHVAYSDGFRHLHPADIIPLRNGEILLMTREGAEHYSNDGDVVLLRSKDRGLTFEGKQYVANVKDMDEREGCGVQLKDGTIVAGFFYNNLYNPDGTYGTYFNWEKQHNERVTRDSTAPQLGAYIKTSTDNGKTWSKPFFIDTKNMPFKNLEGPTDAPVEMPDGSIVMGVIGYSPNGNSGNRASVLIRSTDKGKNWSYVSTIAGDADGSLGGFFEPGIVRTKTGRIVAALRNHGADHAIWTSYSDDNGKTWAPVQKTAMTGHPVDLVQLKDGRVMASYGIRTGPHTKPGGIRVCFSKDNGATWDISTEKQLRADFINWDTGYPESLQLPDGRILTVYYYNIFGRYYIGSTFWKP